MVSTFHLCFVFFAVSFPIKCTISWIPCSLGPVCRVQSHVLQLEHPFPADRYINLCVGKEWYRYPGGFFLPSNRWRLEFIRSELRGQLPKPYSNTANATQMIPTNMNDMNKEKPSRFISVSKCDFLVDLATERKTKREPNFEKRFKEWEVVIKKPFLEVERSRHIFRAFYIPLLSSHYTSYVNYVLPRSSQRGKVRKRMQKP